VSYTEREGVYFICITLGWGYEMRVIMYLPESEQQASCSMVGWQTLGHLWERGSRNSEREVKI